jgi:hypothetical protein
MSCAIHERDPATTYGSEFIVHVAYLLVAVILNLPSRVSRLMVAPSLPLRWRSCSFIEDILEDAISPTTGGAGV